MQNNIQIKISCLLLSMLLLLSFSACRNRENDKDLEKGSGTQPVVGNKVENPSLYYKAKVAMHVTEDGWVYIFTYAYDNDYAIAPYVFQVKNIRYSTTEEYPNGPGFINWGKNSVVPGRAEDMITISTLLGYNAKERMTVEELLALDKDDIELKTIDEDFFFSLIHQAINQSEPCEVGPYIGVASSGMMIEHRNPETGGYAFLDGYTFQIGYVSNEGTIAAIHVDVLFEDADKPFGFSQLSDMIDAGEATEEQVALYAELKRIEQGVLDNCDFLFENTEYDDKVIAGVDLARLAVCLERLEYAEY